MEFYDYISFITIIFVQMYIYRNSENVKIFF